MQYESFMQGKTNMRVPFSYLERQFSDIDPFLADVKALVASGDFTLGTALKKFEDDFATLIGVKHAIGVGSGTDALLLSLKAIGIAQDDEVITCANTFIATVGAIAMAGARPVFVDCNEQHVIDTTLIEQAITAKTKAIMPVHYTGNVCNMPEIQRIAAKHGLQVIEDCCQAIQGSINGSTAGSFGATGAFSVHPLKNLNVWGDGGIIVTNSDSLKNSLHLLRNHGLINRDEAITFGHNSRLDTLQAVIGNRLLPQVPHITKTRIEHAQYLDTRLSKLEGYISVPQRQADVRHVFHLYVVRAQNRDKLLAFLHEKGVEAKIHYPIPMHLQKCCEPYGYKRGDFPITEEYSENSITLPAHQHLSKEEVAYVADTVEAFYS